MTMAITTAQQAVQLQAAQAQALLAVGNVRNQANPQQNPFNWNGLGLGGSMPPLLPGTPPVPSAIYPQMAAFTAAQENATAMVAVAKLGAAKGNVSTNSALVLRNTIRKFNVQGTIFTVAQWTRKTVEENLEYLTKIVKRHAGGHGSLLLAYGDGCETILLLDSQIGTMPDDISKLKRIDIGCSIVKADCADDEEALSKQGVLQPTDSLWEHLRFETIGGSNKDDKCLFIHTAVKVYGGSIDGRRRVLQVATGAHADYKPNPIFEQQVLARWAGVPVVIAAAAAAVAADELEENVTLILFNPKELLLLEKAFDNRLTTRDLKAKAEKWTDEDKKAAQSVIKRANDEFVMRGPPRKRRKKDNSPEEESKAASKPPKDPEPEPAPIKITPTEMAAKSPAKKDKSTPAKKVTKAKASPTKKGKTPPKADDDDDNEPISKMVKKTPSKKHSRRPMSSSLKSKSKSSPKTKSAKTPSKSEKKGRKSKESASKKRSTSKGRSKK